MTLLQKITTLLFLFLLTLNINSFGQVISADSIRNAIVQQELDLQLEENRIKNKQDSLRVVLARLEQQQKVTVQAVQSIETTPSQSASLKVKHPMGKRIIGLNPFHFLLSGLEMSFETVLSKRSSIAFTAAYHNMENYDRLASAPSYSTSSSSSSSPGNLFLNNNTNSVAYTGVRFQAQYRNYIFQDFPVLTGLYLSPYAMYKQDEVTIGNPLPSYSSYNSYSYQYEYNQYFAQALGAGIDIGFQMRVLRYFTFNPFVGFGAIVSLSDKVSASEVNIDILNPYKSGMSLRTGVSIGYMF